MKHIYRNIICILLILLAVAGIILMALNLDGSLDNLGDISRSISGSGLPTWFSSATKEKTIMTINSDYNGTFYMRRDAWGEPKDSLCTSFNSGEKYTKQTSYNPLGYYTKKAINSNAKRYYYNVEYNYNRDDYRCKPDYSETGINENNSNDVACKSFKKNDDGYFYPEVNEKSIKATSFSDSVISNEEEEYKKYVYKKYTKLPGTDAEQEKTKERILNFAKEKGLDKDSETIISDVTKYFNANYTYDTNEELTIPKGENYALYVLFEAKKGVCNNFASASYYLYRSFGIPTRIVAGYLVSGGIKNDDGTYTYVVKGKQCHAWNEVYIDGCGWKRVDNTPGNDGLNNNVDDDDNNNEDTKYGKGTIQIEDEYKVTYDGNKQYIDPNKFFTFKKYSFTSGYSSLNPYVSNIIEENGSISLTEILELVGKNDKLVYEFKYNEVEGERINPDSYTFYCSAFNIVDENGIDVTNKYGITFEDSEDSSQISYNNKYCLLTIEKASIELKYDNNIPILDSELPYIIKDINVDSFVLENTSNVYQPALSFSKQTLSLNDFIASETDINIYECILTPTITIYNENDEDCTNCFDFDIFEIKFILMNTTEE